MMVPTIERVFLQDLYTKPILFDANIFMVGIERSGYSFDNMKTLYLQPIFDCFQQIYIHNEVYKEVRSNSNIKNFIDTYTGINTQIVDDDLLLYNIDARYTSIFNNISQSDVVNYHRGDSKNRGEVYSLAYAVYHNINYFSTRDVMVDKITKILPDLVDIDVITFDIILLSAYLYYERLNVLNVKKGLKSLYKTECANTIRRYNLPKTFSKYIDKYRDRYI